jgi:enoyl-CoA hydratase/carnithine racemase
MFIARTLLSRVKMSTSPFIIVKEPGLAGVIQLNRPKALNALTPEMFQ